MRRCVDGGRLEDLAGRARTARPRLPATFITPARMRRPSDDRPRVVEVVDAVGDVEREQVGEGVDVETVTPVSRSVVAVVVEARRGDDVDPGPPRQLGELAGVATASQGIASTIARSPSAGRLGHLDRHRVDVAEVEVGLHQRPAGRRR